jgi:hypothetical protein
MNRCIDWPARVCGNHDVEVTDRFTPTAVAAGHLNLL